MHGSIESIGLEISARDFGTDKNLPLNHVDQMVSDVAISSVSSRHIFILLAVETAKNLVFGLVGKQCRHLEKVINKKLVRKNESNR